jgi:hypothetical protein
MSKFPQAVFSAGGTETSDDCEGQAFTSRLVNDDDELADAQEQGWHTSVADLVKAVKAANAAKLAEQVKQPEDDQTGDDTNPPTRAELEQKATELGVEFSPKLGDKKLAERIAAKLAEQDA